MRAQFRGMMPILPTTIDGDGQLDLHSRRLTLDSHAQAGSDRVHDGNRGFGAARWSGACFLNGQHQRAADIYFNQILPYLPFYLDSSEELLKWMLWRKGVIDHPYVLALPTAPPISDIERRELEWILDRIGMVSHEPDTLPKDTGYPRTVQRADGKCVTVYYHHEVDRQERMIAATNWQP